MNIDFNKLITLLLPTFMRNGLTSIVQAVASQFTSLYTDFQLWQIDIRLQAAMTCQVMYLETILNYRLLGSFIRTIYISDGDGVIVDFIINVPAGLNVDNYRMIALIEKYKIAGKRYIIGQSAYTYQVNWSDFYCESAEKEYVVQWIVPVCELLYEQSLINNLVYVQFNNTIIHALSPINVASRVLVSMHVIYLNGHTMDFSTYIEIGTNLSPAVDAQEPGDYGSKVSSVTLISVSPQFDATYNYSSTGGGTLIEE